MEVWVDVVKGELAVSDVTGHGAGNPEPVPRVRVR